MKKHRPTRPDSSEARAAARGNPGGWLYDIDPFFDPEGDVPPYGVAGAWKVDDAGRITDDFEANPNYRPSPKALGFPEPVDPLDGAIQLAVTGYADELAAVHALLRTEVFVASGRDEQTIWLHEIEGESVVLAFSHTSRLPQSPLTGSDGWDRIAGTRLVELLPADVDLIVNVGGPARWVITSKHLRRLTDADR